MKWHYVYRISQWKVNDKNILENTFQSFQIMGPKSSDFYSPEEKKSLLEFGN